MSALNTWNLLEAIRKEVWERDGGMVTVTLQAVPSFQPPREITITVEWGDPSIPEGYVHQWTMDTDMIDQAPDDHHVAAMARAVAGRATQDHDGWIERSKARLRREEVKALGTLADWGVRPPPPPPPPIGMTPIYQQTLEYAEGKAARAEGERRAHNPYASGEKQGNATAWWMGWDDQDDEQEKDQ